jgi:putative ABC transport system permease protein
MLLSTFTAFYRSFTRHPLYALLNLLGLSFGIAVFITLGLFFRFETTFEQWLPNASKIYVVENAWKFSSIRTDPEPWTSGGMLDDIKAENARQVGTRVWDHNVTVHIGANSTQETTHLVDSEFFKAFNLPLVAGSKTAALASPANVVISQVMAEKYFPGQAPDVLVGKTIRLTDEEGTHDYRISAVLKARPDTTAYEFDFVRLINRSMIARTNGWERYGSQRLQTVLVLNTPKQAAEMNARFPAFLDRHAASQFGDDKPSHVLRSIVTPIAELHLEDEKTRTAVYVLGIVGILAFLIAAINYINLATARAGMRAKEVAVRKTLGATQGSLRTQFLCEALLTTVMAALIGLSIVELSLPHINSFGDLKLKLDYAGEAAALTVAGAFIVLVGLLAGLYPAFVLSGFKPAQVLASSRTPAGGRMAIRLREALVVLQFAIVIAFFIMGAGFLSQLNHMKTADVGFKREGLMVSDSTYDPALSNAQREAIWAAFRNLPGVIAVTASNTAPGDNSVTNNTDVSRAGNVGRRPSSSYAFVGPDYFKTYGGTVIAGRMLDPSRGEDVYIRWVDGEQQDPPTDEIANIIINRTASNLIGFKSPQDAVDQVLDFDNYKARVAGVIEDMRFRSPKDKVAPMVYLMDLHPHNHAITGLRYSGVPEPIMRQRMEKAWKSIAPQVPFEVVSGEANIEEYYKPDRNRSNLFSIGAGVAALIGCIGLYGMAAFNTSRRAREIGLRKVLGASSGKVVGLLVGQFLRPVLLANLIAWPLAWYALTQWLSQFDDAVALDPLIFVAATLVAMTIALLTVGGLALASASTEPGKALRHE